MGIEIPLRESLGEREIKNTNKTSLTIILKMLIEKIWNKYTEIIRLQGLTEMLNILIKDFYVFTKRILNYNQWNSLK